MKFKYNTEDPSKYRLTWPPKIPKDFIMIYDTREQLPLFQDSKGRCNIKDLPMVRSTLTNGDYSVKGYENKISIERKGASDFFTYIGLDRDNTEDKIKRLDSYDFVSLVVDGMNEDDLLSQQLFTTMKPNQTYGFLLSWEVRHGFHFYCNRDRGKVERYVLNRLIKYYNIQMEPK